MTEEIIKLEEYKKENPNRLSEEQFEALRQEVLQPEKGTISDERLDFRLWRQGLPSRQEYFAAYLKDEILPEGKLRILEVGCGKYPKLSVLLSKMGYRMTCMDPRVEPAEDEEIEVRKENFHYENVDLSGFDFVVAQEPCEATEHIVRACTRERVPFLVALCGVPHELICGGMPEDVFDWYDYLEGIDEAHTRLYYTKLCPNMTVAMIRLRNE